MTQYVVQVDRAPCTVPAGATTLSVLRNHTQPNTVFSVDAVVNAIGRPLTTCEEDFLDLLHAIHVTDLICARGRNENWTRELLLALPLRAPQPFQDLIPVIQETFGMMTFDRLRIELTTYDSPPPQRFPTKPDTHWKPDAVVLLSGGIDSACAGAQLASTRNRPLFVSSRSSSHVSSAQSAVVAALQEICPSLRAVRFQSQPRHKHPIAPLPASDLSQRARTFLYVGIAAVIAVAHDVDEIVVGENGIMAINCPLTPGRAAGFSTRTAHPDVLDRMASVIGALFKRPFRVANPLLLQTKVDVVRRLAKLCGPGLIQKTHSCWIARQANHCGHCVPCIVRRFASEAARVPDVAYVDDSFQQPDELNDEAFASIGDYLLFIRRLRSSSDVDLLFDYPDLNIGGDAAAIEQLIALHRKWAGQVEAVVKRYPTLRSLY
jgi:7-cyano-7-deazaguanine synthase in queuosine biosynthesis